LLLLEENSGQRGEALNTLTNTDDVQEEMVNIIDSFAHRTFTPEKAWIFLNSCRPISRYVSWSFFVASIALTLVFVAWTTPREVFRIHNFLDTLVYLL